MALLKSIMSKVFGAKAAPPEVISVPAPAPITDPVWAARELLRIAVDISGGTQAADKAWDKIAPLVAAGANVNITDAKGLTPLMLVSTRREASEIVEKLIAAGADPNKALDDGDTALLRAAAFACPENMRVLLDHGANAAAIKTEPPRASFGDFSIGGGERDVFYNVIINRFDEPQEMKEARAESLKLLMERGHMPSRYDLFSVYFNRPHLRPLFPDVEGARQLEDAVDKEDAARVKELLAQGVKPDAAAAFGADQALFSATTKGNLEIMDILLAAGADINLLSPQSNLTPLQRALWAQQKSAFDFLLERDADPGKLGNGTGNSIISVAGEGALAEHAKDALAKRDITLQKPVAIGKPLTFKGSA